MTKMKRTTIVGLQGISVKEMFKVIIASSANMLENSQPSKKSDNAT